MKVTRAAFGDPDATRRFRAERQILATLHHPNIVTLLFLLLRFVRKALSDRDVSNFRAR